MRGEQMHEYQPALVATSSGLALRWATGCMVSGGVMLGIVIVASIAVYGAVEYRLSATPPELAGTPITYAWFAGAAAALVALLAWYWWLQARASRRTTSLIRMRRVPEGIEISSGMPGLRDVLVLRPHESVTVTVESGPVVGSSPLTGATVVFATRTEVARYALGQPAGLLSAAPFAEQASRFRVDARVDASLAQPPARSMAALPPL